MGYKDPEKKRANDLAYREKNKEKLKKQSHEYYLKHREETIQRTTQYHHEHKEERKNLLILLWRPLQKAENYTSENRRFHAGQNFQALRSGATTAIW